MAEGTPIGALAVRIGGDASDLISELKKADAAIGKTAAGFAEGVGAATKFAGAAALAGAAVFAFAKNAADTADQMGKMSQKIGISVEKLSSLKYAAAISDVSFQELGASLRQLSKYMVENHFVGISVEDQLLKIADEFARSADGAGKTAAAIRYFGKSGAELIPFLNQGRAGIEALRKEAERLGIVMSKEATEKAEQFNDNLTKLKASSEALAVTMGGPLVTAITKASKAMLDAKLEGEDFFSVYLEGWRALVTGDDADKWNKSLIEAEENLRLAQQQLDRVKHTVANEPNAKLWPEQAAQAVEKYTDKVAKAQAEVKRLMKIKPFMNPDEPEKKGGDKPKEEIDAPGDPATGAALQEGVEEEARVRAEAAQLTDDFRKQERERIKAFRALDLQDTDDYNTVAVDILKANLDEQNRIKIEAYDREQEEAYQHGQELIAIEEEVAERQKTLRQNQLTGTQQFLGNLSSLMNTNSRKTFEFGKAAAIAEGGVKAALATVEAWEFGNKIGGPYVGAAFGAAAAIAGLNYINNIRQQTFGGGGGAPTPAGQGASGISAPAPATTGDGGAGGKSGPDTIIHLHGESVNRKQLRSLFDSLNEEGRDGSRLILSGT